MHQNVAWFGNGLNTKFYGLCNLNLKDIISFYPFLHCRAKLDKKPLPLGVDALKKKANAYFEKEQYTKAIILYNQAIARAPNASMLYGNRAAAYMKRKW